MQIFLSAFDDVPDPRADNARHDLGELLVVAFVAVLCGAMSCADMAAFWRSKVRVFRDFLKLRHDVPSHDTFSAVFGVIDPAHPIATVADFLTAVLTKALDAAFGRVLASVTARLGEDDVVAIDGKAVETGAKPRRCQLW